MSAAASAAAGVAAAAGAAAATASARATAVMGPIVIVERDEFLKLLSLEEKPLLIEVREKRGTFKKKTVYIYVTSIKGLTFITTSEDEIRYGRAIKVSGERLIAPPALRSLL